MPMDPELEQIAARAAKLLKTRRLQRLSGMDEVAVRLNCEPLDQEIAALQQWGACVTLGDR